MIQLAFPLISFDGKITALEKNWNRIRKLFRRGIKPIIINPQIIQIEHIQVLLLHQFYQERRRAGGKPIAVKLLVVQGIDDAVRIEDILTIDAEMVAIIMLFELSQGLLVGESIMLCHLLDTLTEILGQFRLGNAATTAVLILQRKNLQIVQLAEDAELTKLGDTCDENKANVALLLFGSSQILVHLCI